jgi:hypothetical protein
MSIAPEPTTVLDHGVVKRWLITEGTTIIIENLLQGTEVPLAEAEVVKGHNTGDEDGFNTAERLHTTKSSGNEQLEAVLEHWDDTVVHTKHINELQLYGQDDIIITTDSWARVEEAKHGLWEPGEPVLVVQEACTISSAEQGAGALEQWELILEEWVTSKSVLPLLDETTTTQEKAEVDTVNLS